MAQYTEYPMSWNGIEIVVRHCPSWIASTDTLLVQHIELHTGNRDPLPVTETGYRSHFLTGADVLAAFDHDPVAYVVAWLDHEARAQGWQPDRQMSLF